MSSKFANLWEKAALIVIVGSSRRATKSVSAKASRGCTTPLSPKPTTTTPDQP